MQTTSSKTERNCPKASMWIRNIAKPQSMNGGYCALLSKQQGDWIITKECVGWIDLNWYWMANIIIVITCIPYQRTWTPKISAAKPMKELLHFLENYISSATFISVTSHVKASSSTVLSNTSNGRKRSFLVMQQHRKEYLTVKTHWNVKT